MSEESLPPPPGHARREWLNARGQTIADMIMSTVCLPIHKPD